MAEDSRRGARIAGILLAGGASTRMGTDKLLLELDGVTLVRRAATRALAAGLEPVVAVVRSDAGAVRRELASLPVRIELVRTDGSMAGSLRAGVAAVPPDVRAAVVLLADMPLVTSEMVRAVADSYRQEAAPIVASEYGGIIAPPVLYDRSLFAELGALSGETAGKEVIARHRREARVVGWPEGVLQDLDQPGDLARLLGAPPPA